MGINTSISQKDSYIIPNIDYMINVYIREYDISQANINILLSKELIDHNLYKKLSIMKKIDRQIFIGKLMNSNKGVHKALTKGFAEYRKKFFEANDLSDNNILSIKKDAIYVINTIPKNIVFDHVEFLNKATYTSFYKLGNLEAYYRSSLDGEVLDIKGISDNKLILHKDYFIEFLCTIFYEIQSGILKHALAMVQGFYDKYVQLELDTSYYRSFDSYSAFNVKQSGFSIIRMDYIKHEDLKYIDISINRTIIEIIYSYISNMIFAQKKR